MEEAMSKPTPQAVNVPPALSTWFVVHFLVDVSFALPLFFIPVLFLSFFGWPQVDPYATRIVAAALFGIGIESLLGRSADAGTFKNMLNLKVIWSAATIIGIFVTIVQAGWKAPAGAWLVLAVFVAFHALWVYWRVRMGRLLAR